MQELDRLEYRGLVIKIFPDDDPMSPRDADNLGTMVCWHRRYNLGDEQPTIRPFDWAYAMLFEHDERAAEKADEEGEDFDAVMAALQKRYIAVILPLFLYDHSGITMSTAPFSCPWDSGQVGYIYVTREKLRKEFSVKRLRAHHYAKAREWLESEVKVYDTYISGGYVGYVIETPDGEHQGSCWGFDDMKYCIEEAKREADAITEKLDTETAREIESERPDLYKK